MKEIWIRVGTTFQITEEEEKKIFEGDSTDMEQVIAACVKEGRYRHDGETYIPECIVAEYNKKYGTCYTACDIECCI